jgi:predicted dinucleotide-binding enzyme
MKIRSQFAVSCLVVCLAGFGSATATAETIAVIGTGNVAGALGPAFAEQGHTIVYGSRDPSSESAQALVARTGDNASVTDSTSAVVDADIVVLAVPGMLVDEITRGLGDLSGKIIIDPTNPLSRTSDGFFVHASATSNTEIIQAAAPDSFVVKAFNTLNWKTMVDPESSGGPVSIPLAGNSADAKKTVAVLVENMGLKPIDVGPAESAFWLEGMLILWINNQYVTGPAFDFDLRETNQE